MAGKNDKWVLFRNYMHNELNITKEDIQAWIQDAIRDEVKNVVNNAYGKCPLEDMIRREIQSKSWFGNGFSNEVITACAKELVNRVDLTVKK